MPATATIATWAIQAEDAPASVGRLLASVLLREGVVDVAGGSYQVAEDTGSNMQIQVGSGTTGDLAVVAGDASADQGVYVSRHNDPTVTLAISASDPGDDRLDLVVLRVYDDDADSSGNSYADVEVIEGTPAASPTVPATPAGAIPLAQIEVGAGVTAITDADITDLRESARGGGASPGGILGYAEVTANQTGMGAGLTDLTGLAVTVTVPAGRRLRIVGNVRLLKSTSAGYGQVVVREGSTSIGRIWTFLDMATSGVGSRFRGEGSVIVAPTAGEHTYKLTSDLANVGATLEASAGNACWIMVEDIGPA
jgi:hypothetical protein